MGISFFESFLKVHSNKLLKPVNLCNQFIVLDGSEILYKLYFECDIHGRGNYVTFQSTVKQFFQNLKKCGITAVVLFDGFKLGDNPGRYVKRRDMKIKNMIKVFDGISINGGRVKPCLCELGFAQVLGELEIISVTGIGDMDETIAVVANILKAPVIASDTLFCTFRLENGVVPLHTLDWKKIWRNEAGEPCLRGRAFYQRQLANVFSMDENAIPFILIFFPNVSWIESETFRHFCETNFEDIIPPQELLQNRRPSPAKVQQLEKALVWLSQNYQDDGEDDVIQRIVSSLPEEQQHRVTSDILSYLESRREPRGQTKVLDVIRERIEDPFLGARLEDPEIRREEKNDALVEENELEELVEDSSSLSFPVWAIRMILAHATGDEAINYLPLALTDPREYPSPHQTTENIRLGSYKALVPSFEGEQVFVEFDRTEQKYGETGRHLVTTNDVELGPRGRAFERVEDEATMERRRDHLLDTLVPPENREVRARYDAAFDGLNDDLKLPVAATFYWISQSHPDMAAIEALAFQLVICHGLRNMRQLHGIWHDMGRKLNIQDRNDHWCPDSQALHWSSEWQLCLWEAINLNQILGFPLPEPDVAKVFESLLFERACTCFLAGHAAVDFIRSSDSRSLLRKLSSLLRGD